jgi:hypothetical protein
MTLFGPDLHDLKLEDIQSLLDDADAEPLLWEAKATELSKTVCGRGSLLFQPERRPEPAASAREDERLSRRRGRLPASDSHQLQHP